MGTLKPIGSTFSHTAKIMSNTRASQNAGVLAVTSAYPEIILSTGFPRFAPATTPRSSPAAPEISQAVSISHKESLSFTEITWATG